MKQEDSEAGGIPAPVKKEENDSGPSLPKCEETHNPSFGLSEHGGCDNDRHDEEDSDFQSGSDSDSDDSDAGHGRRLGQRRAKPGTARSAPASSDIQGLKNLRNELFFKKMNKGLTDDELEKLEQLDKQLAEAQRRQEQEKKPERQRFAKTARQYWKRQLEKEKEEEDKKRKLEDEDEGPNKARKATEGSHPNQSTTSASADILRSLGKVDKSANDESAPPMVAIQASTHGAQMRQLTEGIPEGCDSRRTQTQLQDLNQAKSSFGYRAVEAIDGKWKIKGMASGLMSHQIVVSAWMTKREAQGLLPAGGLLADGMGLGKTIETLGCIVGHPPEKDDRDQFSRATLVIVNNQQNEAQWLHEIEKHCLEKFSSKAIVYSKTSDLTPDQIATYMDLVAQFPNKGAIQALKDKWAGDEGGYRRALRRKLGKLHKVDWYRVVLDEAHTIKNHASRTTFACWQLRAKFRWVVSGTPISNTVEELYPILRFLRCHFAVDRKNFRANYLDEQGLPKKDFAALISMIMYRRTPNDTFLGRKIVDLPDTHSQDLWVPLEDWEMVLIRAVDNRYQSTPAEDENAQGHDEGDDDQEPEIVDEEDEATVKEEEDVVDTLQNQSAFRIRQTRCMRLRQAVSHPFNLEKFLREDNREEDIQKAVEALKEEAEKMQEDEAMAHAKQMAQDKAVRDKFSAGAHQIETQYKGWSGGAEEMTKLRSLVSNEHELQETTCGLCKKKPGRLEDPVRGQDCKHIFCESCVRMSGNVHERLGLQLKCPVDECSAVLRIGEDVMTPKCIKASLDYVKDFKEPGRDSIGNHWPANEEDYESFFLATYGPRGISHDPVKMPWGSKIKATMEVILTWLKEAPDDKMIVFVEFVRTAKVLGLILEKMGIDFLYYNGRVTSKRKDLALSEFREKPERKILLASMRCGGQALDLQVANRVIIVDMWWNKTVEDQAFARAHRIGQKKETHLARILARGSIDERLYMLQNAKEAVISRALQDEAFMPVFTDRQALCWLFSDKSEEEMRQGMDDETRGKKAKKA